MKDSSLETVAKTFQRLDLQAQGKVTLEDFLKSITPLNQLEDQSEPIFQNKILSNLNKKTLST